MERRHNKRLSKGTLKLILKRKIDAPNTSTHQQPSNLSNAPAICLALQGLRQQKNEPPPLTPIIKPAAHIKVESNDNNYYDDGLVFASLLPELPTTTTTTQNERHNNTVRHHTPTTINTLDQWILDNNIDVAEVRKLYEIINNSDDIGERSEIEAIRMQMSHLAEKVDGIMNVLKPPPKPTLIDDDDEFISPTTFPLQTIDDLNNVELKIKTDEDYSWRITVKLKQFLRTDSKGSLTKTVRSMVSDCLWTSLVWNNRGNQRARCVDYQLFMSNLFDATEMGDDEFMVRMRKSIKSIRNFIWYENRKRNELGSANNETTSSPPPLAKINNETTSD